MHISKIKIKNFKCFRETFTFELNEGLNIIVGNNEAGKSTILEAIHLILSGLFNGKYLRNELSEYLFNIDSIIYFKNNPHSTPPEILIEIFFEGEGLAIFEGDGNSERKKNKGIALKIAVDEKDRDLYNEYIKNCVDDISLPIEYYEAIWITFAREVITTKHLPFKAALIDSSSYKYQNGSDIYMSHIVKTYLEPQHKIGLLQTYRKLQSQFMQENTVKCVNEFISKVSKKDNKDKEIKIHIDMSAKNAWESNMLTHVEDIPFHQIGKGLQAILKTKLALAHHRSQEANIILIEEPENHLSHTRLNELIKDIDEECKKTNKQILISTHNSFVANKLGLNKLIFLNEKKQIRLNELTNNTINYFLKISGYDTLRLILCNTAILCEGDSDELIIQKKYLKSYNRLPIEDGIEVISVGLSFERYIEIAKKINKKLAIVTDNDGKNLTEKYKEYNSDANSGIKVFFDIDTNCKTLEPQMVKANSWVLVNKILDERYKRNESGHKIGDYKINSEVELLEFMTENKTECALKFFDSTEDFKFPNYIERAIEHVKGK